MNGNTITIEQLEQLIKKKSEEEEKNKWLITMEKERDYLEEYLQSIQSPTEGLKYKRICLSPLRYAGGKSKAIGLILENLPLLKEKKIVSPFFGGGSFEIVLSKELGFEVIGYDIFSFLTNFWDQLINHNKELIVELKKLNPDKVNYTRNRHILLHYWDKVKPVDLQYETKNKLVGDGISSFEDILRVLDKLKEKDKFLRKSGKNILSMNKKQNKPLYDLSCLNNWFIFQKK